MVRKTHTGEKHSLDVPDALVEVARVGVVAERELVAENVQNVSIPLSKKVLLRFLLLCAESHFAIDRKTTSSPASDPDSRSETHRIWSEYCTTDTLVLSDAMSNSSVNSFRKRRTWNSNTFEFRFRRETLNVPHW